MPLGLLSHQGLVAPLWRRWPHTFDVPAICVGAAMPDAVDAATIILHGHFAQGIGHSLAGLAVFGIPAGLVAWFLLHAAAGRLRSSSSTRFPGRAWNLALHAVLSGIRPAEFWRKWPRVVGAIGFGALSHLAFDIISHGGFPWLMPWVPKIKIFPEWWYSVWVHFTVPGYRDYSVGPYGTVWLALSVVGGYLLLRPAFQAPVKDTASRHGIDAAPAVGCNATDR